MKSILTFALLFAFQTLHSQEVVKWEYCQATLQTGGFNSKTKSVVDFGEKSFGVFKPVDVLRDSLGKANFKTPVDVMNFLGDQGWECITSVAQSAGMGYTQTLTFKRRRVD